MKKAVHHKMPAQKAPEHRTAAEDSAAHAEDIEEQPSQAWKFFVAFGIVLALLVAGIWYNQYRQQHTVEENTYNGFTFEQREGGIWVTHIQVGKQPYDIPFYYHPRDTEDVIVDPNATVPLRQAPREVYISIDPDAGAQVVVAGVEVAKIAGSKYNLLNLNVHSALSRPAAGTTDFPVFDCKNATPDRVIVQFVKGENNVVARSSNPDCVILQYVTTNDSVKVADRYAYMLLKIM